MEWNKLLLHAKINLLVPDCYKQWRPLVIDGLAWFLSRLSDKKQQFIYEDQINLGLGASPATRISAICQCCPTLHKLGQVLARDNRLDKELRQKLQNLESMPPKMTTEEVCNLLRAEGIEIDNFQFAKSPIAEASVAVVIAFKYKDETNHEKEGVFKLVRPEAEEALLEELPLWSGLGDVLRQSCENNNLPPLEFAGPLEDAALLVADEIKLDKEQEHLLLAKQTYAHDDDIQIPALLPWCTPRVTAMSIIDGVPISKAVHVNLESRRNLAERLIDSLIARPFWQDEKAIFHGDPHGGNIFLDSKSRIAPLDWSLAVELSASDRTAIMHLLLAGMKLNAKDVVKSLQELGTSMDDGSALENVAVWSIEKVRKGAFPGFDWCLSVLDRAIEFGRLSLRAELALFRKALFSLLTLVEDISPDASRDSVIVSAGIKRLLLEWPARMISDPFSRDWATHVSSIDIFSLVSNWPMTATRFWSGWWRDIFTNNDKKRKIG